ncbi:GGDEF domain-containing protein [Endothiovibrio diazotrophicus]
MYAQSYAELTDLHAAELPRPVFGLEGDELASHALRLMSSLQTTLNPSHLCGLFAETLGEAVPFDAWAYRFDQEGLKEGRGVLAGDRLGYELRMGEERLGELALYRRGRFSEEEAAAVDSLIWCLIHPLRNALQHRQALHTAYRDPLTGAYNRRAFDDHLAHEVAAARRNGTPLSLVVIDIDHFKAVNDHFGHLAGDRALQSLAHTADDTMRGADQLYRYGGEEFVLLLNNTDIDGARHFAERLRHELEWREHDVGEGTLKMTASFGVATLEADEDGQALFAKADGALYRAKHGGRNRVEG